MGQARTEGAGAHSSAEEDLLALVHSLLAGHDQDRHRIARELHDGLNQHLAVLNMKLVQLWQRPGIPEDAREALSQIQAELSNLSAETRRLSESLHPAVVEDLGLEVALRVLVENYEEEHGLAVRLVYSAPQGSVDAANAFVLYRIAEEALGNAAKHAPGALVTVRVTCGPDGLCLAVEDDGPGFDPDRIRIGPRLGLLRMRERTYGIGARFMLRFAPGEGTNVGILISEPGQAQTTVR